MAALMVMPTAIPATVWEQAGIVVLFALLIGGVLSLISRILSDQRKSQQQLLAQQQEFIEGQNHQWQEFLERQRCADRDNLKGFVDSTNEKIEALTDVVTDLTKIFRNFSAEVHEHIAGEDAKFSVILSDNQKMRVEAARKKER
jgi:hypothetical protein